MSRSGSVMRRNDEACRASLKAAAAARAAAPSWAGRTSCGPSASVATAVAVA